MEYEQIKKLMDDMGNSKLTALDIEFPDGIKIKMEKKEEKQVVITKEISNSEAKSQATIEQSNVKEVNTQEQKENIVTSPMVGTFYIKPSPNSRPYVEVGSEVKKGSILCIIEAMKLMNEIEAEYDGTIKEILVKDGEAVEYGKPLFRIG